MKSAIHISDSDAPAKLRERIAKLEATQIAMKEANATIRKTKAKGEAAQVAALVALGFPEHQAAELIRPAFAGRIGFANYELTNNGANIRRLKEQLERAEAAQSTPDASREGNGITLEDCPSENRVRLFFPGKPDEATRAKLKGNGFRWTPTLGCWQAYRNGRALYVAGEFVAPTPQGHALGAETGEGLPLRPEMLAGAGYGGEPDYGGVLCADGHVYSDADPGL